VEKLRDFGLVNTHLTDVFFFTENRRVNGLPVEFPSSLSLLYKILVLFQVTGVFKEIGFYQFSVQVEKEQYFAHLAGLSSQLKADFGFSGGGRDSLILIKAI
jgi:hypothetical protein